jgi:hypothetical protein
MKENCNWADQYTDDDLFFMVESLLNFIKDKENIKFYR